MSTFNPNLDLRPRKKQPIWKKKWFPMTAVGLLALFIGMGIGSGGSKTVEVTRDVPGPERTVTQTVEKRVEVPKTPAACLTALDLSEQAFNYAAEALGYSNDALQAAGRLDVAGIQASSDKMTILNPKISTLAPKVNAAKAECRAAK